MKKVLLGLALVLAVGCGRSHRPGSGGGAADPVTPIDPVDPAPTSQLIELEASRTYNPSAWQDATATVLLNGLATVPNFLTLVDGAAGTGWATLTIAGQRFCYQGNGGNNNSRGTGFSLRKAKVQDSTAECSSNTDDVAADADKSVSVGEVVRLQFNGGIAAGLRDGTHTVRAEVEIE